MRIKALIFFIAASLYGMNLSAQILKGSAPLFFAEKAHMDAFTPNLPLGSELAFVLADTTLYRWSRDGTDWVPVFEHPDTTDIYATQYYADSLSKDILYARVPETVYVPGCSSTVPINISGFVRDIDITTGSDISGDLSLLGVPLAITYIQEEDGFAYFEAQGNMSAGIYAPEISYGDITLSLLMNVINSPCYTDTLLDYPDRVEVGDSTAAVRNDLPGVIDANSINGVGVQNYIPYWVDPDSLGSSGVYWDPLTSRMGIGTNTPQYIIDVQGSAALRLNPSSAPINNPGVSYFNSSDNWFHGVDGVNDFAFAKASTATFTDGSVLFADANGAVAQDNSNLFWNNSTKRLGIGTNLPNALMEISNNIDGFNAMRLRNTSAVGGMDILRVYLNSYAGGTTPAVQMNSYNGGDGGLRIIARGLGNNAGGMELTSITSMTAGGDGSFFLTAQNSAGTYFTDNRKRLFRLVNNSAATNVFSIYAAPSTGGYGSALFSGRVFVGGNFNGELGTSAALPDLIKLKVLGSAVIRGQAGEAIQIWENENKDSVVIISNSGAVGITNNDPQYALDIGFIDSIGIIPSIRLEPTDSSLVMAEGVFYAKDNDNRLHYMDGSNDNALAYLSDITGGGGVGGSGTADHVAVWTDASTLGNSGITDDGNIISLSEDFPFRGFGYIGAPGSSEDGHILQYSYSDGGIILKDAPFIPEDMQRNYSVEVNSFNLLFNPGGSVGIGIRGGDDRIIVGFASDDVSVSTPQLVFDDGTGTSTWGVTGGESFFEVAAGGAARVNSNSIGLRAEWDDTDPVTTFYDEEIYLPNISYASSAQPYNVVMTTLGELRKDTVYQNAFGQVYNGSMDSLVTTTKADLKILSGWTGLAVNSGHFTMAGDSAVIYSGPTIYVEIEFGCNYWAASAGEATFQIGYATSANYASFIVPNGQKAYGEKASVSPDAGEYDTKVQMQIADGYMIKIKGAATGGIKVLDGGISFNQLSR